MIVEIRETGVGGGAAGVVGDGLHFGGKSPTPANWKPPVFWGFGVKNKFGINWMIYIFLSCEQAPQVDLRLNVT